MQLVLTPELVLEAYRHGLFPMAYGANSPYINWVCPELRGQLSITDLHIPRRLLDTLKAAPFEITINKAFREVITLCGERHENRPETWINDSIRDVFCDLHDLGHAHSLECWDGDKLVGGIYGLAMGGAFFGESMFSRERDASKIALVHLTARLWKGGFSLLDTQFINDHLKQFGAYEIPYESYKIQLSRALRHDADYVLRSQNDVDILSEYLIFRAL